MRTFQTYSANKYVPDSCSAATAMFCGVKANQKTSGVDSTVSHGDCAASLLPRSWPSSIFAWAQAAGKSTGFATTTRVTHATPSALYAHSADRKWECEAKMPEDAKACKDIARQLVEDEVGRETKVIFGGGRQCLVSNVSGTEGDPVDTWGCYSKDGRDLVEEWKEEKRKRGVSYAVVGNTEELKAVDASTEYVLGEYCSVENLIVLDCSFKFQVMFI